VAKPNSRCTYYFELLNNRNDGINFWEAGAYSSPGYMGAWYGGQSRLAMNSHRVWCQGPRGGVKIVKDRISYSGGFGHGYVTNNPKLMKQFAWIKLSAKELQF
jgi:hypothetical protein